MKKIYRILSISFVIAVLLLTSNPALAGPPEPAEGLWQYQPFILEVREAGCNTFMKTFENGVWTGTFEGTSTEDGRVVIHCSGAWSFKAIVSFEGSVAGKTGTFEMSVVGKRPDATADWVGKYVILSGTGDLADLRGQGVWWGPGAPAPGEWGDIYYEGDYHFKPGK
jgi:hypothetical protein